MIYVKKYRMVQFLKELFLFLQIGHRRRIRMKEEWLVEGSVSKLSEAIPVGSKTQNLYVGQCYLKRLGRPERED